MRGATLLSNDSMRDTRSVCKIKTRWKKKRERCYADTSIISIANYAVNLDAWSVVPLTHLRVHIECPSDRRERIIPPPPVTFRLCPSFPLAARGSLPAVFLSFSSSSTSPTDSRRKSLSGTLRIKIAGAISRTHDIGENATEALIMADTRRAVAATTFYPLTQDSHYTNVPPIIGPQSAVYFPCLPEKPSPRVSQSLQSESCKPTRKSNSSTPPGRVTTPRRCDRFLWNAIGVFSIRKLAVNWHVIRIFFFRDF